MRLAIWPILVGVGFSLFAPILVSLGSPGNM